MESFKEAEHYGEKAQDSLTVSGNAHYTYYRRVVNTQLFGSDIIDGSDTQG